MANRSEARHLKYNIVVMGDPYCGKSSIIERYTTGKYGPSYIQTIASDYTKKELDMTGNQMKLYIFDTAGQEDMKTVIRSIYRHAQEYQRQVLVPVFLPHLQTIENLCGLNLEGVYEMGLDSQRIHSEYNLNEMKGIILVFDFSRKKTLDHIKGWIDLIRMNCDVLPELILLGNKSDLQVHTVTKLDAEVVAASHDMKFLEVSAKKNLNIDKAFAQLADQMYQHRKRLYSNSITNSIRLHENEKDEVKCCV